MDDSGKIFDHDTITKTHAVFKYAKHGDKFDRTKYELKAEQKQKVNNVITSDIQKYATSQLDKISNEMYEITVEVVKPK